MAGDGEEVGFGEASMDNHRTAALPPGQGQAERLQHADREVQVESIEHRRLHKEGELPRLQVHFVLAVHQNLVFEPRAHVIPTFFKLLFKFI